MKETYFLVLGLLALAVPGGQTQKIQIKDLWRLSDDRKTFTIERTLSSSQGEASQKLLFARK